MSGAIPAFWREEAQRMIAELRSEPEPERDYRVVVNAQIATLEALLNRVPEEPDVVASDRRAYVN